MGGGLMQLVAYGAQDIYLTGNPQITFFKVVYRRHTNFSMEAIEQTFNGAKSFGSSVTATISRNGDLVHKMYVEMQPAKILGAGLVAGGIAPNFTNTLLKEVEIEIGGQRIDKHYGKWLTIWNELTQVNPTGVVGVPTVTGSVASMVPQLSVLAGAAAVQQPGGLATSGGCGVITQYQRMTGNMLGTKTKGGATKTLTSPTVTVPLEFWFCRNPGLALPLIALQYHEVKVKILFAAQTDITNATTVTGSSLNEVTLFADYIYLDTDERRRFAQVSHEYLIEQLQLATISSGAVGSYSLNFNHPVKELIWTGVPAQLLVPDTPSLDQSTGTPSGVTSAVSPNGPAAAGGETKYKLKLNGHDRFIEREAQYFTRTQVHQHHSGFGGTCVADSIAVYSFALKPEEHQPSGTCNFSRIDNAQLCIMGSSVGIQTGDTAGPPKGLDVYAINYNVLRIMSGMGGLAYSN